MCGGTREWSVHEMSHLLKRLSVDSTPTTASKLSENSPTSMTQREQVLRTRREHLENAILQVNLELDDLEQAYLQERVAQLTNPMGLPYEAPVETLMSRGKDGKYHFESHALVGKDETVVAREQAQLLQVNNANMRQVWSEMLAASAKALGSSQPVPQRLVEQVSETTRGRRDNYGRPLINFLRIAIYWSEYWKNRGESGFFTPEDVAQFMTLLKIARQDHSHANDNLLDIMGYQDCLDDMHRHMQELDYPMGIAAFRTMSYLKMLELRDKLALES